ncbi:MAG: hypothetical protein R8G01_10455 [Ilumatobacteraceae bacterium]|nr:hypothetical protein [Ilumatobacteraceae bacterium]
MDVNELAADRADRFRTPRDTDADHRDEEPGLQMYDTMTRGARNRFVISHTPFTGSGDLDHDGFRAHLERFRAAGVAVYVGGSGSEANLTPEPAMDVVEAYESGAFVSAHAAYHPIMKPMEHSCGVLRTLDIAALREFEASG